MIKNAMHKDEMTSLEMYTDRVNDQSLRGKVLDIVNRGPPGFSIARDCLTTVGFKNAKRSGVLDGVKQSEWESRGSCPNGLKLVLVSNRKTACSGSSHGLSP